MQKTYAEIARELIEVGRNLHHVGMVPATSGNFSARLSDGSIAITISGVHKGRLDESQIMRIDLQGDALDGKKPSAETGLHTQIYRRFVQVNAVLHAHSVATTLLSRQSLAPLIFENYELLKIFPGINSHTTQVIVPVFANDQNITRLAARVDDYMNANSPVFGYIIAGHGFYVWGESIEQTMNTLEAFTFLCECKLSER